MGTSARRGFSRPNNEAELEELLSRPTLGVVEALRSSPGDVMVLGAGGKMGPSLATMLRRAADEEGDGRRVIAVSRFSDPHAATLLSDRGVVVLRADVAERDALARLPDAPNVIFMAGQKFGTRDLPSLTWTTNTVLPATVAERYQDARMVAFSTGNVYPLSPVRMGGSREGDSLTPVGEYANSCVGRERILEHASRTRETAMAIVRLNYAVDLRYGVLVDLALKVESGQPIDLRMGFVNVIWQGDANAQAIQCLAHAAVPPRAVNVTGPEVLRVRDLAEELGRLLEREPRFIGQESDDALLSNTSLAQSLFGPPVISAGTLLTWVGEWLRAGGRTLGRATKFEERDGRY